MNASSQLRSLYEQWRLLTEQEGQAIRAADWTRVGECQSEKTRLQARIQQAPELVEGPEARTRGATRKALENEFRGVIDELIARERDNERALAAQQRACEERRQDLHQSSRRLRKVRQAYAPGRPPVWHSYS